LIKNKINSSLVELESDIKKLKFSNKEIRAFNSILKSSIKVRTEELLKANQELANEVKERKNAENSFRTLSRYLLKAQEEEKKRLARELHDSINQILSVAKLKLHSTESNLKTQNKKIILQDIFRARVLLEKAIDELRNVYKNLRPAAIDDLGLKVAIESMILEFTKRTKIKVNITAGNFKYKSLTETELQLYRIIQEALHNIEKHSKAKNVSIIMNTKKGKLYVGISDNGIGFNADKDYLKNVQHGKFGLIGMNERASAVGGVFEVKSKKGVGTEIKVSLPIK
jgi:two-component system NarL family sensor kinase